MQTTSEHLTAAHSSSHGTDEDSEGARITAPTCKRSWDGLRRNLMPPPLIIVTRWRANHLN